MSKCQKCGNELCAHPVISARGTSQMMYCKGCQPDIPRELAIKNNNAIQHILLEGGFPSIYTGTRDKLSKYLNSKQVQDLDNGRGIFLIGTAGVGKTKALMAIAERMIVLGRSVRFIDFSDLICDLRADFKLYNLKKRDILNSADCLFFDNFETDNKYMYDFIFNLVNSMYNAGKQVFYANYSLPTSEGLAMRIGSSTSQINLQ